MTVYRSPRARREVLALFDATWPGAGERGFARAAAWGWSWTDVSTPFLAIERQQPVAHIGVLRVPVRMEGAARRINSLHAVCTHPAHRGRGHGRRAMLEALAFCDAQGPTTVLSTEIPDYFTPFGFRPHTEHRWRVAPAADAADLLEPVVLADADQRARLRTLLAERAPLSDVLCATDPGWLVAINAVLSKEPLLHWAPGRAAVLGVRRRGDTLRLLDVIAPSLPPVAEILSWLPPARRVELAFSPDRLSPPLRTPVPADPDDVLMVRGPFPVPAGVMLPPLSRT